MPFVLTNSYNSALLTRLTLSKSAYCFKSLLVNGVVRHSLQHSYSNFFIAGRVHSLSTLFNLSSYQTSTKITFEPTMTTESSKSNEELYELIRSLQESSGQLANRVQSLESQLSTTPKKSESSPKPLLGAIDQGTTSTRFLVFTTAGEPVASHQVEFTQYYPHPGWHEHDPLELVQSVETCIDEAYDQLKDKGYDPELVQAIGITNQRETTVLWDTETGQPLHNAIVWTDTRASSIVRRLKEQKDVKSLPEKCGLPLSTYPSVTKILWMLENEPKVKEAYEKGTLAFGTVDSWLVYRLNGGPEANVHVSDVTNSSRTMFMDLKTLKYDDSLIEFFDLDQKKIHLPKIVRSADKEAYGKLASTALKGARITGVLGDQSAALVGQKGFSVGAAKNTYGTGCFLLYNVGSKPVFSQHGLLATPAYWLDDEEGPQYALEGSIAVAGSAVKWLTNQLGIAKTSQEVTQLASTVQDTNGVVFVTAFSGLFAPYWIDDVKGTLFGLTTNSTAAHISLATLSAPAFLTRAILTAMSSSTPSSLPLTHLLVDGGMASSEVCMQAQADVLQIPVIRPRMLETTALGAAIAAGIGIGIWKGTSDDRLRGINEQGKRVFEARITKEQANERWERWEKAVEATKHFV